MTKKENKKGNLVVRDMKECFRSFNLPVYKNRHGKDMEILAFTSQICNDHVCAFVAVTFDRQAGYVGIDASFHRKVPSEKMAEISKLLNLLNGVSPIYGYSICQCCNTISLRSSLFLPEEILSKGKFRRLIHEMLEDTYISSPLIAEVINGGNPEAVYGHFMDDHRDLLSNESKLSEGAKSKILGDMEMVMTGLKISIEEADRLADGFVMDCTFENTDFPLRLGITLNNETEMVRLILSPPFIVPDVKIPVTTELVNLLNRAPRPDHLLINRQTKRVVLLKAIMIDNDVLDKRELEMSIRTLLGSGSILFPIINEQLSSNESPEVLLKRIIGKYTDSHQESK